MKFYFLIDLFLETKMDNFNTYFEKLNELCELNSFDFIEYYEDFCEMRETKEMLMKNEDFRKTMKKILNKFCLSNGLYYRVDKFNLEEEEKTFLSLITSTRYQPQNRYRQHILKYYFDNLDKQMKDINLESLGSDFCKNYYAGVPGISSGLKKETVPQPCLNKSSLNLNIGDLIKYGEQFQFDVEGFPKNQFLYLLFGLCVYDVINTEHKTFKDLINHIQAFIQLNILSKCFNGLLFSNDGEKHPFNLLTFIDIKDNDQIKPNKRYQVAKKYISDKKPKGMTKLKDDDRGLYILTEYTTSQIKRLWDELEQLYLNKDYDGLINKWFDSQCLTRSTCLIGCILISVLKNKIIKFKTDEMPDWKSILTGDYLGTFDEIADIPKAEEFKNLTLNDVLFIFKFYTSMIGFSF